MGLVRLSTRDTALVLEIPKVAGVKETPAN